MLSYKHNDNFQYVGCHSTSLFQAADSCRKTAPSWPLFLTTNVSTQYHVKKIQRFIQPQNQWFMVSNIKIQHEIQELKIKPVLSNIKIHMFQSNLKTTSVETYGWHTSLSNPTSPSHRCSVCQRRLQHLLGITPGVQPRFTSCLKKKKKPYRVQKSGWINNKKEIHNMIPKQLSEKHTVSLEKQNKTCLKITEIADQVDRPLGFTSRLVRVFIGLWSCSMKKRKNQSISSWNCGPFQKGATPIAIICFRMVAITSGCFFVMVAAGKHPIRTWVDLNLQTEMSLMSYFYILLRKSCYYYDAYAHSINIHKLFFLIYWRHWRHNEPPPGRHAVGKMPCGRCQAALAVCGFLSSHGHGPCSILWDWI